MTETLFLFPNGTHLSEVSLGNSERCFECYLLDRVEYQTSKFSESQVSAFATWLLHLKLKIKKLELKVTF